MLPGLSDLEVGTALTRWVILTVSLYLVLLQCWPVSSSTQWRDQEPEHVGEGMEGSWSPAAGEAPAFLPSFLLPASSSGSVFCPRPVGLLSLRGLFCCYQMGSFVLVWSTPPPERGFHSLKSSVLRKTESHSDSSVGELKSPGDGVSAAEAKAVARPREQCLQRF